MTLSQQLTDYIHAAFSGVWIQTQEPDEAEREILQHAAQAKWRVAVWDIANGLQLSNNSGKSPQEVTASDPLAALRALPAFSDPDGTSLLLVHNFHRYLTNPEVVQTTFTQLIAGKQQRTFLVVLAPVVPSC